MSNRDLLPQLASLGPNGLIVPGEYTYDKSPSTLLDVTKTSTY